MLLGKVLKPLWAAYEVLKRGATRREPLELDLPGAQDPPDARGTVEAIVPERSMRTSSSRSSSDPGQRRGGGDA